ncbi:MAG: hypothetical protein SFW35_06515 [Chitinophagales bacterium]|nr:hypothetical protein [Chitinophagales bacterium]
MRYISRYLSLIALVLVAASSMTSCMKDKCSTETRYTVFEPVYMSYDSMRNAVASEQPRALDNPGKIWTNENYLYIVETDKGVHVIDNSNPSSPQNIAFINIPGNIDIAVRNNILYADSYIDLVAIDISNPQNATEVKRVQNALPQRVYEYGYYYDATKGVPIEWVKTEKVETYETNCGNGGGYYYMEGDMVNMGGTPTVSPSLSSNGSGGGRDVGGRGGSMARFTIYGNYLYVVDNSTLHLYDISNPSNPSAGSDVSLGWNIETIFPAQGHLFIGSTSGMHIYNLDNPANPTWVSTYEHVSSCDPVVVQGDYAFVTLRSGTPCQGFTNTLEVVDISNMSSPTLLKSYEMHNPHGLAVRGNNLFLCEGDQGLKTFDITDKNAISNNLLQHLQGMQAYDVIAMNQTLMLIGANGLFQYNISDPANLQLLSTIAVQ